MMACVTHVDGITGRLSPAEPGQSIAGPLPKDQRHHGCVSSSGEKNVASRNALQAPHGASGAPFALQRTELIRARLRVASSPRTRSRSCQ